MAKFVRDLMSVNLVTLDRDDSIASARRLMMSRHVHSVLIPPPAGGKLWSIFTETDLLISLDSGEDPNNIPISIYASPITHTAHPDWEYKKALEEMINYGVKHLPVIDSNGSIIGMISSTDLINNY